MPVKFYLDNRPGKSGDAPIRVSIALFGARFITSTGYAINPAKWNAETMRVKQGATNAKKVNYNTINAKLGRIASYFEAIEGAPSRPENMDIKALFLAEFGRPSSAGASTETTFWDYYAMFCRERGRQNDWTKATYQKFDALKNHLREFDPRAGFDTFTESGLLRFVDFCRNDLDMKNSTIGKQLGYLKWFLNWATSKGYNARTDYKAFNPKLKQAEKKVVFLDWPELMRVYSYQVPKEGATVKLTNAAGNEYEKTVEHAGTLEKVRDVFCFCAFTSLRYSDARNLKKSDIHDSYISVTSIKTQDLLNIELTDRARAILGKYAATDLPEDRALPVLSNQRMNDYLKDLMELCGINTPVTQTYFKGQERIDVTRPKFECIGTHTARRTFICNALMLGIPPQVVMKWTGHNDYKAMKPYIDIADSVKAREMDKFNRL
jgi:integrase